jgi:adenylate cyclase
VQAFDPDAGQWEISRWVLQGRTDAFGNKYSQLVETSFGPVLYTGGPIRGDDGSVVGAVLIGLPIDEFLARLTKDNLAHVTIYEADGGPLHTTLPVALDDPALQVTNPAYLARVRTGSVFLRTIQAGGTEYLELVGGLVIRDQISHGLGVAVPTSYIHESSARTRLMLSLLFSGVVVAVLFIGLLLAGRITAPIRILVEACRRVAEGDFAQQVHVGAQDETGILADTFNDMVGGLRERDLIRDTFGRYMSPEVAEQVLHSEIKLGGETREVTLLMSDIRDFTGRSETMTPEQLITFLNRYFQIMVGCVIDHRGIVDKFMGDAILAVFGAPIVHEGHATEAALAALDMRAQLKMLNQDLIGEGYPPLRIGVGINTGEVVTGNLGSEARMEYTVIGDAVNATQRIEDLTKEFKTDILVADTTLAKLADEFEMGEPHYVTLRGRHAETAVYPLIGLRPSPQLEAGSQLNGNGHLAVAERIDEPASILQTSSELAGASPPEL